MNGLVGQFEPAWAPAGLDATDPEETAAFPCGCTIELTKNVAEINQLHLLRAVSR